jgi:hypothetical protein
MLRETLVTRAMMCDGLSYGNPATKQAYKDHLFGSDTEPNRESFAKTMMSCLLHARALMGRDEVDGFVSWGGGRRDVLREPYANFVSHIETLLQTLARQRKLLVTYQDQEAAKRILVGGALLIHGALGKLPPPGPARDKHLREWGGVAHGMVVTEVLQGGKVLECVDGGQLDPGNIDAEGRQRCTRIAKVYRRVTYRPSGMWIDGRRFCWGMDMGALPLEARPRDTIPE